MNKKVIVITGGSRGIGAATAQLAATRAYAVCVNYLRNRQAAEASYTTGAVIDVTGGR